MRMDLFQQISLQLQEFQRGQAREAVRLYKLYEVVIQMEADQTVQTFEETGVH